MSKAKEVLKDYSERVVFVKDNYENVDSILNRLNIPGVDGILLDIGVSSHQLDEATRGFSHNKDAPLDMRMDRSQTLTAWDVVNKYSMKELENIIFNYGEERWARRIAEFIVEIRTVKPINTTLELVSVIKKAIPKQVRMEGHHPAKKTFQAIRIEVNRELEVLERSIEKMVKALNPGGRLNIINISFLRR